MSPKRIGPLKEAWYRWKALRLPWRKRFLVGHDLEGNTYWEFRLTRDPNSAERWRRIVQYPSSTHYSQVKVSPQWHQWLRHTREAPPAIGEQQSDVVRRARMKILAAEADARWEAKPRVMEDPIANRPVLEQPATANTTTTTPPPSFVDAGEAQHGSGTEGAADGGEAKPQPKNTNKDGTKQAADPWAKARASGPGESWQPTAWNPTDPKKR
jgi:NADH dehydrogenase [ubiquinone] 1 alpha subcomplex assembly factor 2